MTITDQIRKLIIARANTRELGKVAISQGMRTLAWSTRPRAEGISTLEQSAPDHLGALDPRPGCRGQNFRCGKAND